MKNRIWKIISIVLIIIIGILGIKIWQQNNKNNDFENNLVSLDWRITLLPEGIKRFDTIRHFCQNKQLIAEQDENGEIIAIKIIPDNIQLKKIGQAAKFIDYTFDKKCQNVYAIVDYNKTIDLFKFDIKTGQSAQLTNNLYKQWCDRDKIGCDIEKAQPLPNSIYTINDDKLLISSTGITTGLAQCLNLMDHIIYNIKDNKFTNPIAFAETGGIEYNFPPTILNLKNNILSQSVQIEQPLANERILVRKDFDLNKEQFLPVIKLDSKLLADDFGLSQHVCLECPKNEGQTKQYDNCIIENLKNIFPESK